MVAQAVPWTVSEFVSQATNFRHTNQPEEFSQLTRRFVLQLFDRLDAAQRHVSQQNHDLQRRVIAAERREGLR